jgi:hypothetical protein
MTTVNISVHGGRGCRNCEWITGAFSNFGHEDTYMDVYSDRAVVAIDQRGHVAGVWKYDRMYPGAIRSSGTWVAPKYRKRGLAKKLWQVGISHENAKRVKVCVISDRGYSLVHSMQEQFPKVKWTVEDNGCRKLRKLPK